MGTVVFDGEQYDEALQALLAVYEEIETLHEEDDDFQGRSTTCRCACTWSEAAAAAAGPWQERAGPLLETADAGDALKVARRFMELHQDRLRTMVNHPAYGRPSAGCAECGGSGRAVVFEYERFDYYDLEAGRWGEVLVTPCRTPGVWPLGDDLWMQLYVLFDKLGLPHEALDSLNRAGIVTPLDRAVTSEFDRGNGYVPVRRLLELDAIPDTLVCVTPSAEWLEREETEIAEDLASWHGRIEGVLRDHPNAQAAVVGFHV